MDALDLLVIGGGITGLATARLAARNGISVALVERADLASGASSASSHMLHGGLRYLEHGRLRLVGQSLRERAAVSRMTRELARPMRFLVPLYRGGRVPPWKLRLGLALYDALADGSGFERHAWLDARAARDAEPALADAGLRGAGRYADGVMDDARLAVAVARDAAAHGAAIATWTEAVAARRVPSRGARGWAGSIEIAAKDRIADTERSFRARVVMNAAGPWADAVRALLAPACGAGASGAPLLRPSRGAHLVYPALTREHALLLLAGADGRPFFVVPFAGRSLVGTTEVEVPSPPPADALRPSLGEVRYLRAELARALPASAALRPLAVYAGVRPLLSGGEEVGRASREHRAIAEGAVVTIAGGKYTTFRVMARDAMRLVARALGRDPRSIRDDDAPLPAPAELAADPEALAARAAREEFARRLEDVMRRRSLLWLEDDRGRAAAPRVARGLAQVLGWSAERARREVEAYESALADEEALIARSAEGA